MTKKAKLRNIMAAAAWLSLFFQQAIEAETPDTKLNPSELHSRVLELFDTFCVSCHGPDKQKGDVRLDALETIDPVERQELFAKAKEAVHFLEMPPEKAEQPSDADRQILMRWLDRQLTGEAAKGLAEKLQRSEFGNVVDHVALFSGEHADEPGFTWDRRWLISEFIFDEKVNRLIDYHPTRKIDGATQRVQGDSGVHWSPKTERGYKFRMAITNPFLLPEKVGVRYYANDALTTGHLLTMIGNAKRIAGHMSAEKTMQAHYPAMHALMKTELDHRETLRAREQFLTTYTFIEQLLEDIYGGEHQALLPELVRIDVPFPGPKMRNGKPEERHTNLEFLRRFNPEDIEAIFHGIATYQGDGVEFEEIVRKSERDWFMYGATDYRIKNRIATMKIFYDQWDMDLLHDHIGKGNYSPPKYVPLDPAEMAEITLAIKKHRKKGDRFEEIIEKCVADWETSFEAERKAASGADEQLLGQMVVELFAKIFEREPTETERAENVALMKSYLSQLERQPAIAKLIESLILSTEFAYRFEFGQGEPDAHGRRMMSPRDASYALAYALTDSSPDEELVRAVEEGRLETREDYEREVRRMLDRRDRWTIIDEDVQAANLNASVTNQPIRKLRFFREFFGYPKAMKVFKDDTRFGAGRHEQAVSRLIDEADLLVAHILEQDVKVFETLLTTDKFYVFHSGNNEEMRAASDQLKRVYEYFKDYDWENWEEADLAPHKDFMSTVWEFRRSQGNDKALLASLKRNMELIELQFGEGQSGALPYMKQAAGFWHGGPVLSRAGQQMRGEQVTTYFNIDWRTWDYPAEQPARIPNRKGMLTHPAWLIAHAQNLETDPIHRGKWVREQLLAGTIPDVPITVDAVIPPDHTRTLRQRMETRTGDTYCWRCHEKMDPLGFPFEIYDDFGRFRTEERLEHPDNLLTEQKKAPMVGGIQLPVYKTAPVEPRGVLEGTGDPKLDGEVEDAFDMIDRLAKSDRVRQSIIRHAFRYFLGRNEMLSDSKTLMDAENAYLESDGSFDAVIVSLLTSDSFIYRKPGPD